MQWDPIAVARASYQAYVDKDRAALERLVAANFHFTSPMDNRLDREAYFKICWPNSRFLAGFDFLHCAAEGDRVFVAYEATTNDGKRFRNTELLTVQNGKLVEAEVFFGWDLPHRAPTGQHIDKAD